MIRFENVKDFPSAEQVGDDTLEDLQAQRPYYAAFCLQYTPRDYHHEEKTTTKKIVWIACTKAVQCVATGLPFTRYISDDANQSFGNSMLTATSSCLLICINLWYSRRLLRRPYVSHRPSKQIGDPMNDAEILTTRAISWSLALLTLRDGLAGWNASREDSSISDENSGWVMDGFGGCVLVALIASQRPLFRGAFDDVRENSIGVGISDRFRRTFSLERTSSLAASFEGRATSQSASKQRHSGISDLGSGSQIEMMMQSESYRKILWMQTRMRLNIVPKDERERWVWSTDDEKRCCDTCLDGGRKKKKDNCCLQLAKNLLFVIFVGIPLLLIFMGVILGCILGGMIFGWLRWIMFCLPTFLCVVQDFMIWRTRAKWFNNTAGGSVEETGVELKTKKSRNEEKIARMASASKENDDDDYYYIDAEVKNIPVLI